MKLTDIKKITESWTNGRQEIKVQGVYKVGDRKLKIKFERDTFDAQSYAKIYSLNKDEGWYLLHSIPSAEMESVKKDVFAYRKVSELRPSERTAIQADIKELKKMAIALLF